MAAQQGNSDPTTWRWERAHQAFFAHNPFDKVELLRPLFSRTVATGGDTFSVNVNSVSFDRPFGQYHGVSYRQIVDFADLEASRFVHTTGQSGHPLSAHYDDLVERWLQGVYLPMRFDPGSIERSAVSRLRLVP
jgi:penicillin amidase